MRSKGSSLATRLATRLLGDSARRLLAGRLARYSPALRYIAVALWFYRFLKKRSDTGISRVTLKPGEAVQISSTLKK